MNARDILSAEGAMNTMLSLLLNNGKYKSREEWQEENIYEEYNNLEKDLQEYQEKSENETRDFEQNMRYENFYFDNTQKNIYTDYCYKDSCNIDPCGLILSVKPIDSTKDIYFKENVKAEFSEGVMIVDDEIIFLRLNIIPSVIQYIDNIYLKIEIPESLFDLSDEQKYSLLNTNIMLKIGGQPIIINKLATCIFNQICSGKNIIQNNNIIEIPIFNFDTMVDNKKIIHCWDQGSTKPVLYKCNNKNIPEKYKYKGLPVKLLAYHQVSVWIDMSNQYIKTLKYSIICNGYNYSTDHFNYHFKTIQNKDGDPEVVLFPLMENQTIIENIKIKHELYFNNITKAILIYYSPLTYQSIDQIPIIEKITLSTENIDLLYFEANDLLDIDIFGIKMYVLPLSKEFSDLEHINQAFSSTGNVLKELSSSGVNFGRIDKVYLHIDFYNDSEPPDNYIINISAISLNYLTIVSGMCGKAYACNNYENYNKKKQY
jgi:hypothetical protein